jgi:hypothetical protein
MHYGSGSAKAKSCDSAIAAPDGRGDNFDDGKNSCLLVVFFLFIISSPYDRAFPEGDSALPATDWPLFPPGPSQQSRH